MLDYIKLAVGVLIGIALMVTFNALVRDPLIKREARQGYVLESRATALEAQVAERDRQIAAGKKTIIAYEDHLREVRAAEALRVEQTEKEIADYEQRLAEAGRSCLLDRRDIEWLRN